MICRSRRHTSTCPSIKTHQCPYDSAPGGLAHYQPFDIAEPLNPIPLAAYSLNVNYRFPNGALLEVRRERGNL